MRNNTIIILIFIALAAVLIAGCTQPQQPAQPTPVVTTQTTVNTVYVADSSLGRILTDTKGITLYYFITDVPGSGASTCYGNCETAWPVFSVDSIIISSPLNAADFSTITRTNGTKQTTYRGWPLYYWQNDKKPGDVLGENVLKVWYVAKPDYNVMIASKPVLGAFLTDNAGKSLYYFTQDTAGKSTCSGTCLANWPAFNADSVVAPSVLKATDFSVVTRADGVKQTAFRGRPLYYFAADAKPGDIKGDGVNTVWFVANVSGSVPSVTTPSTTVPTTTRTTSPSSGGY
jgi:predicted lipoprotein with Yx(FWY)xxD motif